MGRLPPGLESATVAPGLTHLSNHDGSSSSSTAVGKPHHQASAPPHQDASTQEDEGQQWGSLLQAELLRAVPSAGPQVTVNVLYSFAKLGRVPEQELLQVRCSVLCSALACVCMCSGVCTLPQCSTHALPLCGMRSAVCKVCHQPGLAAAHHVP